MTKKSHLLHGFLLISFFLNGICSAQSIKADEGSYGIDAERKLIIWQANDLDSIVSNNREINTIVFEKEYKISSNVETLSNHSEKQLKYGDENYALFITQWPIVHIVVDTNTINDKNKIPGYFTYYNDGEYMKNTMGIRHRGNLSLTFPKKSYDIEFRVDSVSKESKDLQFKGLRSDDDWILDGLYNEPLRLRSTLAIRLWNNIHKPHYLDKEPKAKSGFDSKFVEVFKNQKYIGLYALSESVDRKQLALKKHVGDTVLGELFKAESYQGATNFTKAPDFNNLFPHWAGFYMEYPLIDYRAHWNDLSKFVTLAVSAPDEEFVQKIEKNLRINNAIDYYLFVNLVRATDNLGKNYYLGRFDADEPYFFIPWDVDGVFGTIQDGKRIPTTNDILSNQLFDRLLKTNPNGYKEKVKSRWKMLRENEWSDATLYDMVDRYYHAFLDQGLYEREAMVWPDNTTLEDHYNYLKKWINERTLFLDAHFKEL
ncbi:CotH kinase family protein [Maribacter sp. 2210JD10-5]|uniref:CotH kinase family protein n=1 Tax=Maribacter sp. 2210JD10-5 TaxID=3386272 RepID=UPI0039BC71E4